MITVSDLHKNFETPQLLHILQGINLEIAKGELLCIVGASGVGKSTFLHLLGGLDRPTLGKILYEGQNIAQLNENQLAEFRNKKIGFVFQFHHLLPEFTALENAMMPALIRGTPYQNAAERAKGILREVGLSQRFDHKPGELSGGEQQRVAVARALCLEPQVVLADEPTGNLDTHTGDEIFALLKDLNKRKGLTLVIVTHNEKLSAQADRIVRMVDGRIEAV
ncbi:MAG TPA: ABC transporter ATP-binding protein [Nitrospiria bacterium]|jgi:lipoprotein-releasing system ATP-binding protein|nr:ABC transporter ATP-binding protein [Nitrospiria bacterium]